MKWNSLLLQRDFWSDPGAAHDQTDRCHHTIKLCSVRESKLGCNPDHFMIYKFCKHEELRTGWLSVSYYTGSVGRTIIRQDKTKDHGGTSCSSQPRPGQGWPGGTLGQFSLQLIGWHGARVKTIKTFSDESVICQAPVLWCLPTCLQCPVRAHNDIEMRY